MKIMISGIMDFTHGGLTEPSLADSEIRELIHIAHEEGFPVMAHTNGSQAVRAAALAGVDSIEHGNFCDEDALRALAASDAIWVPTLVTNRKSSWRQSFSGTGGKNHLGRSEKSITPRI